MHKLLRSYLKKFVSEQSIEGLEESKQFERFSNFCIVYKFYPTRFDIETITSEEDDCGIDGIAFMIDDELIATYEEAEKVFKKPKNNIKVDLVFIQSKRSEKFDRGDILKFGDGVSDFLSDSPNLPQGDFIRNSKKLFDLVMEEASSIVNGKPNCHLFYVSTGIYNQEKEIKGTFDNLKRDIVTFGYFQEISISPVDRDELINLWSRTCSEVKAKFEVQGYIPFPAKTTGITEAYIAIVPAQKFIDSVLSDPKDKKLRHFIFQENVRSFLGQENPVNNMIRQTLSTQNGKERFGILNNGITIISPDVKVQGNSIHIENFQIVNGCQTSNILYENRNIISPETMLTVKVVEATDTDVIGDIVKATNSQTKVENIQFLSLKPILRKVEKFFEAFSEDSEEEVELYFERRERQFVGKGIPDKRIFDIKTCSRAVASMFLESPHLAARYPTSMIEELNDQLFDERNQEIVFYTASLALYRIDLLIGNNKIPYNFKKYKWHMLMCIRFLICGSQKPHLKSKRMEKFCQKIIDVCKDINEQNFKYFKNAEKTIKEAGEVTPDRLKRQPYTNELKKILMLSLQ